MKTATIDIYAPYGTNDKQAYVTYRGLVLKAFDKSNVPSFEVHINGLLKNAKEWAFNNGFTHVKIKE